MAWRAFGAFYTRSFQSRPWLTLAVANGTLSVIADGLAQTFEHANAVAAATAAAAAAASAASSHSWSQASNPAFTTGPTTAADDVPGFDIARSARFLFFGMGMAPLLCEWNKFIENNFPLTKGAGAAGAKGLHGRKPTTMIEMEKLEREKGRSLANGSGPRTLSATIGGAAKGGVSMLALGKRVLVDQGGFAPFGLALFVGFFGVMEGRSLEGIKDKYAEMYLPALLANWKLWPLVQTVNFRYMPLRYRVPFTSIVGIFWTLYLSLLASSKVTSSPIASSATAFKETIHAS